MSTVECANCGEEVAEKDICAMTTLPDKRQSGPCCSWSCCKQVIEDTAK